MDVVSILLVAFFVGIVVGMTGMGGGALMTPSLIFLGINPSVAIANDLVAAAFSKSVGAVVHWREGSPNMSLVKWLVIGSVPSALLGSYLVSILGSAEQETFLKAAIGFALLFAATTYTLRIVIATHRENTGNKQPDKELRVKPLPTLMVGVIGGLLVGITSVGAGSIIMVALVLLYPMMRASSLVGTDLAQAVPLVMAAAIGHVVLQGVDWGVLIPLVAGSIPGTYIGARMANRVQQKVMRRAIVIVLMITGLYMLGVPSAITITIGMLALIFGPMLLAYPLDAQKKRYEKLSRADDSF